MKKTVIINYKSLCVGGIESYIFESVKHFHKLGYRVIWLHRKKLIISEMYKSVMLDSQIVENYPMSSMQLHFFRKIPFRFESNEEIVILSFTCQDHVRALKVKKDNPSNKIRAYFIIPHFTGCNIYPEQAFRLLRNKVNCYMASVYKKWIFSGTLIYCSPSHIEVIEQCYNIEIPSELKQLTPESMYSQKTFDKDEVEKRFDSDTFNIVSAGRFDFPHKGFMVGLVREFPEIKRLNPKAVLYFVGEGSGQKLLEEEIDKLDSSISKDIHILGMMPLEKLLEFYKTCQLSISVAGCATHGAKIGLITLPARHYTYSCEVYGFLPESKGHFTDTSPGEPVLPYIKKVLSMSKEEYVRYSEMAFESFEDKEPVSTDILFENPNYDLSYNISSGDLIRMKWLLIFQKILYKLVGR